MKSGEAEKLLWHKICDRIPEKYEILFSSINLQAVHLAFVTQGLRSGKPLRFFSELAPELNIVTNLKIKKDFRIFSENLFLKIFNEGGGSAKGQRAIKAITRLLLFTHGIVPKKLLEKQALPLQVLIFFAYSLGVPWLSLLRRYVVSVLVDGLRFFIDLRELEGASI